MNNTTPAGNEHWVKALRNGDSKALHHYYDQFYGRLAFFAHRIIADTAQAEDFAIVALTKLWEKRQDFHSEATIKSFLYQTVKNACLDWLDHQQVKTNARELILLQQGDQPLIDHTIMHAELIASLHETIGKLPENYREVIKAVFVEGLNHEAAADKLQISEANLRNRKMRALQALRELWWKRAKDTFIILLAAWVCY